MDAIRKIYNSNVYEDGTINYLGKVKEVELPKLTFLTEDHDALGMISKLQLPTGKLDVLEAKITWSSLDKEAWKKGANPFLARKLQIRANVQDYGPGGKIADTPLVTLLTVKSKLLDLGKLAAGAGLENENDFSVTYLKQTLGSEELIEIDTIEQILKVGGVDIIAAYKKSLGI